MRWFVAVELNCLVVVDIPKPCNAAVHNITHFTRVGVMEDVVPSIVAAAAEYIGILLKAASLSLSVPKASGATLHTRSSRTESCPLLSLAAEDGPFSGDVRLGHSALAEIIVQETLHLKSVDLVDNCVPPAKIPTATVEHDNLMLHYAHNRNTCMSGARCVGASLDCAPGPLGVYVIPSTHNKTTEFCLLCMRADAEAVHTLHTIVAQNSPKVNGQRPVLVPPVKNLVDCIGGYKREYMGVEPSSVIFTPVWFAGSKIPLRVIQSSPGLYRVDQDAGVFMPSAHFLGVCPPLQSPTASTRGVPLLAEGTWAKCQSRMQMQRATSNTKSFEKRRTILKNAFWEPQTPKEFAENGNRMQKRPASKFMETRPRLSRYSGKERQCFQPASGILGAKCTMPVKGGPVQGPSC